MFQAQRYWSGADLAGRLEVTSRTLRRDVDRLRSLGYPVNSTSGAAGGYQLGMGAKLPPLLLDDDEAVAVAVGLRTAASGTVSGMEETSLRALTKLEQVLPERLQRRVAALHSAIVPLASTGPVIDAEMLSTIAGACRDYQVVRFRYQSREGAATEREVEPHRLVHTGRRWYLAAWDLARQNWRTFRIDRIQNRISLGSRFAARTPPDGDFAAYVSRSVAYQPYAHRAKVLLQAPVHAVAERIPGSVGILEAVDDGTCLLHMGAGCLDGLSIYIALLGFEFEILEPPELIERLRVIADRFTRAAARRRDPQCPAE